MGSRGALGSTTEFTAPAGLTMSPIGLCSVSPSELKVPAALSEPAHYIKAEHLLAEIGSNPALSNETETSPVTRAVAHAVLAAAAAIVLGSAGFDSRVWQKAARQGSTTFPSVS